MRGLHQFPHTLVCNLGTHNQGSAVVLQAPIKVTGSSGDQVSASGSIGGQTASLAPIDVLNAFGMDMLWGTPTSIKTGGPGAGNYDFDFEWTLNLKPGSEAGPNTVTDTLTTTTSTGTALNVGPQGCSAFTAGSAGGHPWSGGGNPAGQTAPFVGSCVLTQTGRTRSSSC